MTTLLSAALICPVEGKSILPGGAGGGGGDGGGGGGGVGASSALL